MFSAVQVWLLSSAKLVLQPLALGYDAYHTVACVELIMLNMSGVFSFTLVPLHETVYPPLLSRPIALNEQVA